MLLSHGALLKTTLLDYPGEVASVIFTPGCNLRCPYCYNPSLVENTEQNDQLLSIDEIKTFLEKRKNLIGAVVISGGEPLIYENIPQLIDFIHDLGLKVKIDTNGLYPDKLNGLKVEYIAMDIKTSPKKYKLLGDNSEGDKVLRSISYIIGSKIDHEFRTTVIEDIVKPEDIKKLVPLLIDAKRWYFTAFRPGETLDPQFKDKKEPSLEYLNELKAIAEKAGIESYIR